MVVIIRKLWARAFWARPPRHHAGVPVTLLRSRLAEGIAVASCDQALLYEACPWTGVEGHYVPAAPGNFRLPETNMHSTWRLWHLHATGNHRQITYEHGHVASLILRVFFRQLGEPTCVSIVFLRGGGVHT